MDIIILMIGVFIFSFIFVFCIKYKKEVKKYDSNKTKQEHYFDKSFQELKLEIQDFDRNFDRNTRIFHQAKSLESTNPYKAIELYTSIRDSNYGNFDTLGRLIILYRKTKQIEKEIQHIDFKIEQEQNRQYNRKESLKKSYPKSADYIEKCYRKNIPFVNPHPLYSNSIDFFAEIKKLSKRKLDLLNKTK